MLNTATWKRAALVLALVKVSLGVAALAAVYSRVDPDPVYPWLLHLVYGLPFTAAGILLVAGGRRDPRAISLGGFFLMAATSFFNRPLRTYVGLTLPGHAVFAAVDALELDAFMAYFLWTFARDFPHQLVSTVGRQRIRLAVLLSLGVGLGLFSLNILHYLTSQVIQVKSLSLLAELIPMRGKGLFYIFLLPLTLGAFGFLIWRGRQLDVTDHRRVRLFLQGFGLAAVPMLAETLIGLMIPAYQRYKDVHPVLDHAIILVHTAFVLMLPLLTPYAVLVHQVLDVKLLARKALRYALARYSATALAAVPLAALAFYLWQHNDEKLREIFSGYRAPFLVVFTGIGFAALSYRKTLLEAIDRRFFREQFDARRILTQLLDRIRATSGTAALASLVSHEVDLALHLEGGVSMLVLDPRAGVLSDPRNRSRRLDASSHVALMVSDNSDPLVVNLDDAHSPLSRLPEAERHWLVDSGFRLIVPSLARDGTLLGLMGLGEKRSGLPFLKEDRELLRAIAGSAAWVIELDQTRSNTPIQRPPRKPVVDDDDDTSQEPITHPGLAKECIHCGKLFPSYTVLCSVDSRRLEPSHVPYMLPGKFRFECRIGAGGMGVVYRGSDLALGRPVAVKTLRRVSPEDAMRLRREARTAAAVSHPHLAPVYGMETWQGTPMLVLELLEGGTLAHRLLDRGRLTPQETIDLGISMCDALAQLHGADILHRDIKPSNIGYTASGVPKLMDFGIARLMYDLRREREEGEQERRAEDPTLPPASSLWTHIDGITPQSKPLVGTLSYLCPEALEGKPPDAQFDLWSLAIVLYECLLGRKVFSSVDPRQTAARIRMGRVPDLLQLAPESSEVMADLFRIALHRNRSRRPETAGELRQKLEAVRGKV